MPGIKDFQAQMTRGFARPNLFRVDVFPAKLDFHARFSMGCFQAQIPGNNLATTDKDTGYRSIAYQKIFSDIILGFYAGEDMRELMFWQDWIDNIIDKKTNYHEYYNNYVGVVMITKLDRQGEDVAQWILHDAYPKQVDPIQLDYGTNDAIMTINTTITYRYFEHEYLERPVKTKDTSGKGGERTVTHKVPRQNSDYVPYNKKLIQELNTFKEFRDFTLGDRVYDASKDPSYNLKSGQSGQSGQSQEAPNKHGDSTRGGMKNSIPS
tara:strand:+ start:49 stop:846 length:798 start_codon:yes stop_codon:yes gene_type:complete